jgi:hypothetical protein
MTIRPIVALAVATLCAQLAFAAVTPDEAAKLKGELTPLGAQKAGNKEGTIPAWTGGIAPAPGGGRRPDPFKDEKPLLSITAKNMDQYADKLTEGVKLMLKRYPDSYRLDVYPTHRTAAAPQWVYDNTFKNATRAKLNGYLPEGAYGGIPFPVAKTGAEAMWNHILGWRGTSERVDLHGVQVTANGQRVLTVDGVVDQQYPYYFEDGSPETFKGVHWLIRLLNAGPPIRAGEAIVGREHLDGDKTQSWVYLTGQRRVRKLPQSCCDTPTPATAGVMSFDEIGVFSGRLDRFDWKVLGKKEMYIPYNSNRSLVPTKDSDLLGEKHLNPDHVRWELHRVWEIEATLGKGQRHLAPRSRYYLDEDTWLAILGDRWDANGQLWKTTWSLPIALADLPGVVQSVMGFYDFVTGGYFANNVTNEKVDQYKLMPRYKDSTFTPEALAGEGTR